jgi:hypothetical protein
MGREAQKKREEEVEKRAESAPGDEGVSGTQEESESQSGAGIQIDPSMLGMLAAPGMTAMKDERYLVQTVAVGKKDGNGLREISFPITPMNTITLVLAEDLQEHILKQLSGGIEVADLSDLEAVKKAAAEEGKKS